MLINFISRPGDFIKQINTKEMFPSQFILQFKVSLVYKDSTFINSEFMRIHELNTKTKNVSITVVLGFSMVSTMLFSP